MLMKNFQLFVTCLLASCGMSSTDDYESPEPNEILVEYLVQYEAASSDPFAHHLYLVHINCELAFMTGPDPSYGIATEHYEENGADVFVEDRGRELWFYRVPSDRAQPVEILSSTKRTAMRSADGTWRAGPNPQAELIRPADKIFRLRAQCGAPYR